MTDHVPAAPIIHEFTASGPIAADISSQRANITLRAEPGTAVRIELRPLDEAGRELAEQIVPRFDRGRLVLEDPKDETGEISGIFSDFARDLGRDFGRDFGRDGAGGAEHGDRSSWADRLASGMRAIRRTTAHCTGALEILVIVPEGSSADLRGNLGGVAVSGALSRIDARVGAGSLRLERSAEDLTRLTVGPGAIVVGTAVGALEVTSGSGDLSFEEISGKVSITSGTGAISVRRALAGAMTVRSGSGAVTVGVAPGTAAHLDLATGSGRREVDLSPAAGAGDAERTFSLQVRTGRGDLRVLRADASPMAS